VLASAAAERAEQAGAWGPLCEALGVVGRTARNDSNASAAAFRRAAQVAAEHGLTPWRVEALFGLGTVELCEADDSPTLWQARELALDAGMLVQAVGVDMVLTEVVMLIDGPRAAEQIARRASELAATVRLPGLHAGTEVGLAGCRGALGDRAGMELLLESVRQRVPETADFAAYSAVNRGMAFLVDHDLPRAATHFDTAMEHLLNHGAAPPLIYFGAWALLCTAVADRDAAARDRLRRHSSMVRRANRATLDCAEAIAAGRAGRLTDAEALFDAADTAFSAVPWWRRVVRLLAMEAAITDGWGDPVPVLRADLRAHELTGDAGLARTCRDLLRQAGAPTRRGRGHAEVPADLRALSVTSREADVLALVTQGMTNAQIAQRLFLSTRTVETHVARLLAKTGAATRGELSSATVSQTP